VPTLRVVVDAGLDSAAEAYDAAVVDASLVLAGAPAHRSSALMAWVASSLSANRALASEFRRGAAPHREDPISAKLVPRCVVLALRTIAGGGENAATAADENAAQDNTGALSADAVESRSADGASEYSRACDLLSAFLSQGGIGLGDGGDAAVGRLVFVSAVVAALRRAGGSVPAGLSATATAMVSAAARESYAVLVVAAIAELRGAMGERPGDDAGSALARMHAGSFLLGVLMQSSRGQSRADVIARHSARILDALIGALTSLGLLARSARGGGVTAECVGTTDVCLFGLFFKKQFFFVCLAI
jgi:hypothetical protein